MALHRWILQGGRLARPNASWSQMVHAACACIACWCWWLVVLHGQRHPNDYRPQHMKRVRRPRIGTTRIRIPASDAAHSRRPRTPRGLASPRCARARFPSPAHNRCGRQGGGSGRAWLRARPRGPFPSGRSARGRAREANGVHRGPGGGRQARSSARTSGGWAAGAAVPPTTWAGVCPTAWLRMAGTLFTPPYSQAGGGGPSPLLALADAPRRRTRGGHGANVCDGDWQQCFFWPQRFAAGGGSRVVWACQGCVCLLLPSA